LQLYCQADTAEAVQQALFTYAEQAHVDMLAAMTPPQMQEVTQRRDELLA